jgi:hypothetical protein
MMLGTPASRAVCKEVARLSGGTIFLGFSRGKDSVAAWLWLREFFPRVIPFHCAAVPGLGFVERSLAYYEELFQTPIIRCLSGELLDAVSQLVYQPIEDEDWIDALDWHGQSNEQVVADLRRSLGLPNAWVAWGISATDSVIRRSAQKYDGGKSEKRRALYPCFDWPKALILNTIEQAGASLPEDYRLACRSFAGVPGIRHLARMREVFPEDFERVKLCYPFVEAQLARMEFRKMRFAVTSKKPSLPLTGNDSTARTLPSTKQNESGSGEQRAAGSSPAAKRRQSRRSTRQMATPAGP